MLKHVLSGRCSGNLSSIIDRFQHGSVNLSADLSFSDYSGMYSIYYVFSAKQDELGLL